MNPKAKTGTTLAERAASPEMTRTRLKAHIYGISADRCRQTILSSQVFDNDLNHILVELHCLPLARRHRNEIVKSIQ